MMFCQKCKTPLRLDSSLSNLGPAAFNLLADTGTKQSHVEDQTQSARSLYSEDQRQLYDTVAQSARGPIFRRSDLRENHVVANSVDRAMVSRKDNAAMSFVMLNESVLASPTADTKAKHQVVDRKSYHQKPSVDEPVIEEEHSLSQQMERTDRLFEILSARSDIDHPVCVECTDMLIERMERRLAGTMKERDQYIDFLKHANADIPTEEEREEISKELKTVRQQERTALAVLEQLEAEKAALEEELTALDQEARSLDEEETSFWRERNALLEVLTEAQNERDSVLQRHDHDSRQLERLQRTNVYNDTFCISHDGHFGTINGLRLGNLSSHPVSWPEINAASGQACLLLATVADKLGYSFQGYRLHSMGSTSTIEKLDKSLAETTTGSTAHTAKTNSRVFPLYYSNDSLMGSLFTGPFESAMIAFLECVRQLGSHVERTTREVARSDDEVRRLPYEIKKDKINDYSVRYGQTESWTKACKFTLTCCKFLLAHASNINGSKRAGEA